MNDAMKMEYIDSNSLDVAWNVLSVADIEKKIAYIERTMIEIIDVLFFFL